MALICQPSTPVKRSLACKDPGVAGRAPGAHYAVMYRFPSILPSLARGDEKTVPPRDLAEFPHPNRAGATMGMLIIFTLMLLLPACAARESAFDIVDYRRPGVQEHYRERFDEAYFDIDEHGNADVVLRRNSPDVEHPSQSITQVIHIRSLWRSIPGTTVAHSTQINGTIRYHVLAGRLGATFEGTGSVFFDLNRGGDTLTGSIDSALLRPKRRLVTGGDLFKKAELTGQFRAVRDPRRVVQVVNDMNRLFGSTSDEH